MEICLLIEKSLLQNFNQTIVNKAQNVKTADVALKLTNEQVVMLKIFIYKYLLRYIYTHIRRYKQFCRYC